MGLRVPRDTLNVGRCNTRDPDLSQSGLTHGHFLLAFLEKWGTVVIKPPYRGQVRIGQAPADRMRVAPARNAAGSRRTWVRSAWAFAALLASLPEPASPQVVRGRFVDQASSAPISGAMVSLLGPGGESLVRGLTRESGHFELAPPAPGRYRLQAERVGYATTTSLPFDVGEGDTLSVPLISSPQAIQLEGIAAEADRRCTVRPAEGLAVARVWEEARKALAAAAWTQDRGTYRYELETVRREIEPDGRRVVSETRTRERSFRRSPYVSRPAADLIREGFARLTPTESVYWAPDAAVLLSDDFLDTHCFRLSPDQDQEAGFVALEFQPVDGRRLPDIAGTLWLDASTSQLTRLDFRYRNLGLPDALLHADIGGSVGFRALPNGAWIVHSWRIRMPRAGTRHDPLSGRPRTVLEGLFVHGADVLHVHGAQGRVSSADPGGQIAGIVFDSLHQGLPGARVFIEGSGVEDTTGADGRFLLARLESGIYQVHFSHPYLDRFSYRSEPFDVQVAAGAETPAQVNFQAPTMGRIVERACQGQARPDASSSWVARYRSTGILAGAVTDPEGAGVAGATVEVWVAEYEINAPLNPSMGSTILQSRGEAISIQTGADGRYLACWVPVDTPLHVAVRLPGAGPEPERPTSLQRDASSPGRRTTVTVSSSASFMTVDLRLER